MSLFCFRKITGNPITIRPACLVQAIHSIRKSGEMVMYFKDKISLSYIT